jgi:hypothetical protein
MRASQLAPRRIQRRASAASERDGAPASEASLAMQRRAFEVPRHFAMNGGGRQVKLKRVANAKLDRLRRDSQRRRGHRLRAASGEGSVARVGRLVPHALLTRPGPVA